MVKQAIRPDFFNSLRTLKTREIAEKAGLTEEELALDALGKSEGWRHFKKRAEDLIEEMNSLLDASVSNGTPMEELGRNTVVVSMAKGVIKRLIHLVDDARGAVENAGGK